jgi:hypothetical protein
MPVFLDFISKLPGIPVEQLMGVIALTALGLSIFSIYVVFTIVRERRSE